MWHNLIKFVQLMVFVLPLLLLFGNAQTFETPVNNNESKNGNDGFGTLKSIEQLIYWINKEEAIYNVLRPRLEDLKDELGLLDKYLESYEDSTLKALDPENVVVPADTPAARGKIVGSNAILSHLMITRYVTVIQELKKLLGSEKYIRNRENIFEELDIEDIFKEPDEYDFFLKSQHNSPYKKFATLEDLHDSYRSILDNQKLYGLTPDEISKGVTADTNNGDGGELKAMHCAKIAMFALCNEHYDYKLSVEWLELATKKVFERSETEDDSIDLDLLRSIFKICSQLVKPKL